MPKLFQINVTSNWGSTGKIAEQIGWLAMKNNWDSYIAYGRYNNPSESQLVKIGYSFDVYEHYIEHLIWDNEGLASRRATRSLVRRIDELKPDIIHLHNIHDHYLNYSILINYLSTLNVPIVWTLHDCWAFTGGCYYYAMEKCSQYQVECMKCPRKRCLVFDKTNKQYNLKKELFCGLKNLTLVPVSRWLENEAKKSFFKNIPVRTILNGIDTSIFKPTQNPQFLEKYGLVENEYVISVASKWEERKNLNDYLKLAGLLPDILFVIVGLSDKQRRSLPGNVITIPCTQSAKDLAVLYTSAIAVLNLSLVESFGLTTIEGLACGTPGIVYNCTASPELLSPETGIIVNKGNFVKLVNAILALKTDKSSMSESCRKRAVDIFDKDKCYEEYIQLYNELIEKKNELL